MQKTPSWPTDTAGGRLPKTVRSTDSHEDTAPGITSNEHAEGSRSGVEPRHSPTNWDHSGDVSRKSNAGHEPLRNPSVPTANADLLGLTRMGQRPFGTFTVGTLRVSAAADHMDTDRQDACGPCALAVKPGRETAAHNPAEEPLCCCVGGVGPGIESGGMQAGGNFGPHRIARTGYMFGIVSFPDGWRCARMLESSQASVRVYSGGPAKAPSNWRSRPFSSRSSCRARRALEYRDTGWVSSRQGTAGSS